VAAAHQSKEHMRSSFTIAANYTVIVWLMYPVFWILGDGLNRLDDNSSVIAFSVLDLASKIGFSAIFFHTCKKSPNWHKALVTFSRLKSVQPHMPPSAPVKSQLPIAPAPAASEATAVVAADAAVDMQSPNPRKARARYAPAHERDTVLAASLLKLFLQGQDVNRDFDAFAQPGGVEPGQSRGATSDAAQCAGLAARALRLAASSLLPLRFY
jgi:hypothetical protein